MIFHSLKSIVFLTLGQWASIRHQLNFRKRSNSSIAACLRRRIRSEWRSLQYLLEKPFDLLAFAESVRQSCVALQRAIRFRIRRWLVQKSARHTGRMRIQRDDRTLTISGSSRFDKLIPASALTSDWPDQMPDEQVVIFPKQLFRTVHWF